MGQGDLLGRAFHDKEGKMILLQDRIFQGLTDAVEYPILRYWEGLYLPDNWKKSNIRVPLSSE